MKPELKDLMQELQIAFNESVCESDRISEILAEIKRSGYEVLLALEVTIGVTTAPQQSAGEKTEAPRPGAQSNTQAELELSDEDRRMLQSMHISVE